MTACFADLQMVMVTEPVFGSVTNLLTQFRDVPTAGEDRQGTIPSPLELKYGLMHVAETVQFLNADASTVHCNLNPETLVVAKDGIWKLSGFAFAAPVTEFGAQGQHVAFEYSGSMPPLWEEVARVSACHACVCTEQASGLLQHKLTPDCHIVLCAGIDASLRCDPVQSCIRHQHALACDCLPIRVMLLVTCRPSITCYQQLHASPY